MTRRYSLLAAALLICASCDDVPNVGNPVPPNPEAGRVRLEVTGTSCSGVVRWDVAGSDNGILGDAHTFPWTFSMDAQSGDAVALQACNDCDMSGDVTITTSIFWEGTLIDSDTRTGPAGVLCSPSSQVQATIP
jgi:hypothetical protein